ncbi:DUF2270 domain-containing protein [Haloterrigena sp. SYSU A558-1]|uniref:DUF2270 domain-containing protein n=1 Tax=Haloterrigena gelatinilytica TaxID=2741724 RepID=A0A8J8KDG5_9EURY|nr:DUF2270 domain-containing protein [Haloterrigena gelatinilytica]NUB90148.1 DUF2270 domain-containing protein [Haloterrigena gelatinilytica]NUC74030.1 DUF2270 domain-containing protein [Haloterrigena gelatinilytica]
MSRGDPDFDPEAPEESEIGREMVDQSTGLGSVAAHLYRGEVERVTTWRGRLDETTNWAVTVMAAILVYAFSSDGTSHAILLVGMLVMVVFLGIEARRYQSYDVWRSRARLLQENLFANALDPSVGVERPRWRAELSEDYRNPSIKMPYSEALGRRLRRVYIPLLTIMLASWLFRIAAYHPGQTWRQAAALPGIPGPVVVGVVVLCVGLATGLAIWPRERRAKGEVSERNYGEWKERQ